jgi:hypothetical protein
VKYRCNLGGAERVWGGGRDITATLAGGLLPAMAAAPTGRDYGLEEFGGFLVGDRSRVAGVPMAGGGAAE